MLRLVAILRFIRRSTVLVGVGLAGGTVTAAGVVMLVTPGPGLLVIIAGLAILATQFTWAEQALDKVKARARSARDQAAVRRFDRREAAAAAAAPDAPPDLGSVPEPPPDLTVVPDVRAERGAGVDAATSEPAEMPAEADRHDHHATG